MLGSPLPGQQPQQSPLKDAAFEFLRAEDLPETLTAFEKWRLECLKGKKKI